MSLPLIPRPRHRATSAHLQALFPFVAEGGLGPRGAYVGRDVAGAPFYFDPLRMYGQSGLNLTNPNILVIGQIGMGKSTLVKCLARRLNVVGYRSTYLTSKAEADELCRAFGVHPLRPVPGGDLRLNPLDPTLRSGAGDPGRDQVRLLHSALAVMLGRRLVPAEERAVTEAVERVSRRVPIPTLRDVQRELEHLGTPGSDPSLALWNYTHGPGRDLFDEPTSVDVNLDAPLVALDLSEMAGNLTSEQTEAVTLSFAAAWLFAAVQRRQSKMMFIIDEAWRMLRAPATVSWLAAQWKLSRSLGCSNVAVLHRLSDLRSAQVGEQAVRGLMADTQTRIIFHQDAGEAELLGSWLGLTGAEIDFVGSLGRGAALWKVGDRSFGVRVDLLPGEERIIDTDAAMRS